MGEERLEKCEIATRPEWIADLARPERTSVEDPLTNPRIPGLVRELFPD